MSRTGPNFVSLHTYLSIILFYRRYVICKYINQLSLYICFNFVFGGAT